MVFEHGYINVNGLIVIELGKYSGLSEIWKRKQDKVADGHLWKCVNTGVFTNFTAK